MRRSETLILGIPVRVNPYLPKDSILMYPKYGPNAVVYIENESLMDYLYRAINSDAEFMRRCGIITHIGDLPR